MPGRPTNLDDSKPTVLAVGADGYCLFLSHQSCLFHFSLSMDDGSIQTEVPSQRTVHLRTINQPMIRKKHSD